MSVAARTATLRIEGGRDREGARLARYLRTRFGLCMFGANLIGAIDVFVLLAWILPTPQTPPPEDLLVRNTIAFVAYMGIGFLVGGWGTLRACRPVLDWLERGGPPTDAERRAALKLPARQTLMHAAM